MVEVLGADQFVYGKVGSDTVTARVDPNRVVRPGETVQLGLDPRDVFVFDAETEARVPTYEDVSRLESRGATLA